MNNVLWQSSVKQILLGVKLYYICSIVACAFGMSVLTYVPVIGPLGKMAAGASVVGAFIFMYGVKAFMGAVNPADEPLVKKLYISLFMIVSAIFVDLIPLVGFIFAAILDIVAFVFMLLAYKGLKESETLTEPAKEGASKLFLAMIIALVSTVFGLIPFAGSIISALIDVAVLYLLITGWNLFAVEQSAQQPAVITE